jgi:hypothetical protein
VRHTNVSHVTKAAAIASRKPPMSVSSPERVPSPTLGSLGAALVSPTSNSKSESSKS